MSFSDFEVFDSSSLDFISSLSMFLSLDFTSFAFSSGFESAASFLRFNSFSCSIFLLNLISSIPVFSCIFFFLDLKIELMPKPFDKEDFFLDLSSSLIDLFLLFEDF